MPEEKELAEKDIRYAYDNRLKEWAADSNLTAENRQRIEDEILRRMQFKLKAAEPPVGAPPNVVASKPAEPPQAKVPDHSAILDSIDKSVKTIKDVVVWWVVLTLAGAALWVVYVFTR
jgi:hypothetical protein